MADPEYTVPGASAQAILAWAYENPAERAVVALDKARGLARRTPEGTRAGREVGDVVSMLMRLEDSVRGV